MGKQVMIPSTPDGPASRRYVGLYDNIRALNQIADSEHSSDEDRAEARAARETLAIEAGEIFDEVLAEHEHLFLSEPVTIDRGLSMLIVKVLVELRHQIDREMERADLTPYMWSTLSGKREAITKVFRIFEGRALRKIDDWVSAQYLLVAEYDDDSVDFEEAADEEEAHEIMAAYVEQGAVVSRYAVYPEFGEPKVLYYPVLPHENNHRPMTQRAYDWVLRKKGADNLRLPQNLDNLITRPTGSIESDHEVA